MTRQGLPAILSKESEKLVPYWQRELTENPKMLGVLERDVNNAVETIDSFLAKERWTTRLSVDRCRENSHRES